MEVNFLSRADAVKWVGMHSQNIIAHRDLAMIGVTHEYRFFDCSLDNIIEGMRFFLVNRNIFWPDRNHRRLVLFKAGCRDEAKDAFFRLHLAGSRVPVYLQHFARDQIGKAQKSRRKPSLRTTVKLMR